jgi:hypothetical protein
MLLLLLLNAISNSGREDALSLGPNKLRTTISGALSAASAEASSAGCLC